MSKVTRIEIQNGDFNLENFSSEKCKLDFQPVTKGKTTLELTDIQARELRDVLDVYLKSRED